MTPAAYDAWYDTPRGRWIGDREFTLLARLLDTRPGETLLDVGTGTGYFARRFVGECGVKVTGIDSDGGMLAYARGTAPDIGLVRADASSLPFADVSFDHVVAITSLCFMADEGRAVREMVRVARRRVALGLLGRHSLLWLRKRGSENYAGARWHVRAEARALLSRAGAAAVRSSGALFMPGSGLLSRWFEALLPAALPCGGFLAVAGDMCEPGAGRPFDSRSVPLC